jgi:hypothetical protein
VQNLVVLLKEVTADCDFTDYVTSAAMILCARCQINNKFQRLHQSKLRASTTGHSFRKLIDIWHRYLPRFCTGTFRQYILILAVNRLSCWRELEGRISDTSCSHSYAGCASSVCLNILAVSLQITSYQKAWIIAFEREVLLPDLRLQVMSAGLA